jgi:hypothetical protein
VNILYGSCSSIAKTKKTCSRELGKAEVDEKCISKRAAAEPHRCILKLHLRGLLFSLPLRDSGDAMEAEKDEFHNCNRENKADKKKGGK